MKGFKIIFIFVALLLLSCQNKGKVGPTDTYTSGVVTITVDESFQPIIQEELDVFEAQFPKAGIVPKYTNEVEAINYLLKDSVRLSIVTRPLSKNELKSLESKQFYPHSYKLATDGIALIINNQNKDSLITVGDLRKILTGEVTTWNQIYPSSKLGKMTVVLIIQIRVLFALLLIQFVMVNLCRMNLMLKRQI